MTWAYSCDHCGASMGRIERKISTHVPSNKKHPYNSYDLCDECFRAALTFIETSP